MCGRQCDQSRLLDEEFEGKPFLVEGLVEQCDVGESLSQLLGLFAPSAEQGLHRGRRLLVCQHGSDLLQQAAVHVRFVGDGQASLRSTEALDAAGRGVEILESASHVGEQRAAGLGESDVPG